MRYRCVERIDESTGEEELRLDGGAAGWYPHCFARRATATIGTVPTKALPTYSSLWALAVPASRSQMAGKRAADSAE